MLDILFRGVYLVDGTGAPARTRDVGVKNGKITLHTQGESARETVEGGGLTLCPGFIDAHSHGDMSVGTPHGNLCKISQGVTTEIAGQCGQSPFPVDRRFLEDLKCVTAFAPDYQKMPFERFARCRDYEDYCRTVPMALNLAELVGHNTLRASVMGVADRAPTGAELALMKDRLRAGMEQGALGLSSGLIYIPGVYCTTEEVIELCRVIRPYGGIYATHMRNEAADVVKSVKEAIFIAESAGVPLVISHHKVCGRDNWGASWETLRLIDEAAARGVRIGLDQYPYEANMTALNVCIPPRHFAQGMPALLEKLRDPAGRAQIAAEMNDPAGGYDNFYRNSGGFSGVFVSVSPAVPEAEGRTVADYAAAVGKGPMDAYFDLLLANGGDGNAIYFAMDPREVERIYQYPRTMVGSDALCFGLEEKGHPRGWGTFIRPLAEFAGEKKLVSFEEAVYKQTGLTAAFWGLVGKGRVAEGYDADLVLLDRGTLRAAATYAHSNQKAEGVCAVYVAGKCVYRAGALTGEYPGKLILRQGT
ncbi:MAG: D-aminoacylase [Clostridia bacterium]|nr:D-aminoacylase [Clostridia bacterium]